MSSRVIRPATPVCLAKWSVALASAALTVAFFGSTSPGRAAVANAVRIVDPSGQSARVDNGKLRVGDGSGPLTVDGTVNTSPGQILAHGECAGSVTVTVANTPVRTIRSIVLASDVTAAEGRLLVTQPGGTQPLMVLQTYGVTSAGGYLVASPDLGGGIVVPGQGNWVFSCSGYGTFVVIGT